MLRNLVLYGNPFTVSCNQFNQSVNRICYRRQLSVITGAVQVAIGIW